MLMSRQFAAYLVLFALITTCSSYFDTKPDDHCFCKLKGRIDDCTCSVDTVDHFNNIKIYPRLKSLLMNDYFRFYKVNLKRDCPFWSDDSRCAIRYCHVEACHDDDIPAGLKGAFRERPIDKYRPANLGKPKTDLDDGQTQSDCNEELSYLNTTISAATYRELALWTEHDDAQDSFCADDLMVDGEAEYVDLLLNPERYTGYRGESAHRIWRSIYMENCFRPPHHHHITSYIQSAHLNGMCLEKRVFYRVVSGLHTSINVHLCSDFLLSEVRAGDRVAGAFVTPSFMSEWGPNVREFRRRFDPMTSDGEGPQWLRNLYFVYLLELRALAKATTYLQRHVFYTGNDTNDADVRIALSDLLGIVRSFPNHFNESSMFATAGRTGQQARKLKDEFRQHFRNISRIMDCVGCDKCKLWGKLQTHGLGTALKILFSGKFDGADLSVQFQLQRGEIVSLMNAFGRLSTSIYELEQFRKRFR